MDDISDGKLLWMIHFDRRNYTAKWIVKAEMEAARRNLILRPITLATKEMIAKIPIASDTVLECYEPRPTATWWKEYLVGGAIIASDILLRRILPESFVWILTGILSFYLLHMITAQGVSKERRILVWAVIVILIGLLLFGLPDNWKN